MVSNSRTRSRAAERELQRDEAVLAAHFLRTLTRLMVDTLDTLLLDPPGHFDIQGLHEQLSAILDTSMRRHAGLQDRWIRRKSRSRLDLTTLPASARPFRHHGKYLGSFASLREAATRLLDPPTSTHTPVPCPDAVGMCLDLHLQGHLWTISAGGQVHAFLTTPHPAPHNP